MAEEASLLVAPEDNKVEGSAEESIAKTNSPIGNNSDIDPLRVSSGSSYHGDSSEGSSLVKISTPKIKEKVIPNYLRPCRGSCHDLCKYGRRLTEEQIHWRSLPKRIGKPPIEIFVANRKPPLSVERKKVIVMKPIHKNLKFSPDHVMVSEEPAEIKPSKDNSGIVRKGSNASLNDSFMDQPKVVSTKSLVSDSSEGRRGIVKRGSNASLNGSSMDQPKVVSIKSSVSDSSEGRRGIVKRGSNASLNGSFVDQPRVVSTKSSVSDSSEGSFGKSQSNDGAKDVKFAVTSKSSMFVDASRGKLVRSRSTGIIKDIKTSVDSKPPWKYGLARSLSLNVSPPSSHGPNHVVRKKKYAKEENNNHGAADDEAEEKMEAECNKEDKGEGLFKTTKKNGKDIAKGNLGMSHKKGIAVMLKDRDSSLTKMKFQRGRTVELQSASSGARKLKFRHAKVLLVNQDGKADVTKTFRKAVINKVRVNPKARKVVLRHRSLESKKDAQGLFNNVIEETASKLVQSRKSKVKALVGAFETVISLQDTKPSSSAVTEGDALPNS